LQINRFIEEILYVLKILKATQKIWTHMNCTVLCSFYSRNTSESIPNCLIWAVKGTWQAKFISQKEWSALYLLICINFTLSWTCGYKRACQLNRKAMLPDCIKHWYLMRCDMRSLGSYTIIKPWGHSSMTYPHNVCDTTLEALHCIALI
jgi:hypothetical protein